MESLSGPPAHLQGPGGTAENGSEALGQLCHQNSLLEGGMQGTFLAHPRWEEAASPEPPLTPLSEPTLQVCHLDNLLAKICPIEEGKFFAKGPIFKFLIYFVPLISTSPMVPGGR